MIGSNSFSDSRRYCPEWPKYDNADINFVYFGSLHDYLHMYYLYMVFEYYIFEYYNQIVMRTKATLIEL